MHSLPQMWSCERVMISPFASCSYTSNEEMHLAMAANVSRCSSKKHIALWIQKTTNKLAYGKISVFNSLCVNISKEDSVYSVISNDLIYRYTHVICGRTELFPNTVVRVLGNDKSQLIYRNILCVLIQCSCLTTRSFNVLLLTW